MRVLLAFLLRIFHLIHETILIVSSWWERHFGAAPQPLRESRPRIPKHLAILFVVDPLVSEDTAQEVLIKSIVDAGSWCGTIGINKLTVYEKNDLLSKCTQILYERLSIHTQPVNSPTPSDSSESPPLSPNPIQCSPVPFTARQVIDSTQKESEKQHDELQTPWKCQQRAPENDLSLCLISQKCSKHAIAVVAQTLAREQMRQSNQDRNASEGNPFELSVTDLEQLLEDEDGLSAPDFMIIHRIEPSHSHSAPPELHCFPPWHIRLTEIYQNKPHEPNLRKWFSRKQHPLPLDEISFREALDEFTSAEMRFGK